MSNEQNTISKHRCDGEFTFYSVSVINNSSFAPINHSRLAHNTRRMKFFGPITQKKENPWGNILITSIFGVLEYWSDGVMIQRRIFFFYNTPILRLNHSQEFRVPYNHLFIGYNSVYFY